MSASAIFLSASWVFNSPVPEVPRYVSYARTSYANVVLSPTPTHLEQIGQHGKSQVPTTKGGQLLINVFRCLGTCSHALVHRRCSAWFTLVDRKQRRKTHLRCLISHGIIYIYIDRLSQNIIDIDRLLSHRLCVIYIHIIDIILLSSCFFKGHRCIIVTLQSFPKAHDTATFACHKRALWNDHPPLSTASSTRDSVCSSKPVDVPPCHPNTR